MTSGLVTALDYVVYLLLVKFVLTPVVANLVSYTAIMILNFVLQRYFVFDLEGIFAGPSRWRWRSQPAGLWPVPPDLLPRPGRLFVRTAVHVEGDRDEPSVLLQLLFETLCLREEVSLRRRPDSSLR